MIEFKNLGVASAPVTVNVDALALLKDGPQPGTSVDLHFIKDGVEVVISISGSAVDMNAKLLAP